MKDLITEARELYDGWAAYDIMRHGGGQGAKSDDGEAERKFMLWIADEFPAMCDALEKAQEQNKQLMHEVCKLACESVERDKALARLEAEVMAACNSARWIPVTERLPEKPYGCLVIVEQDDYWGEPREVMYPHFVGYDGEQWNDGDGDKVPLEITHWMPLPAPPEEGE